MEGVPTVTHSASAFAAGVDVVSFLVDTKIFASKGEAKKMIQNGGVSINKERVDNTEFVFSDQLLLSGKYLLIQKGKKNYYLVIVS